MTRCSGHAVHEIDGRPADQAYAELLGLAMEDLGAPHVGKAATHAAAMLGAQGDYIPVAATRLERGPSLLFSLPVAEGAMLVAMECDGDAMVQAAGWAATRAAFHGGVERPAAALMFSCALRERALGVRMDAEVQAVGDRLGGAPVAGFLTWGEQGILADGANRHANQVVSVLVLGDQLTPAAEAWFENRRLLEERSVLLAESRVSEWRYRRTFEQIAAGMAHVAFDGRFVRVNRRFADLVGYAEEELLSRTVWDITHPDDVGVDADLAGRLARGEIPEYSHEKRYIRSDGATVWVSLSASLLRDESGTPDCLIGVVEEITERKRADAELERARRLLEAVVEQSPIPTVVVTAPDMVVRFANRASARVLGVEDEETTVGTTLTEVGARQSWTDIGEDGHPVPFSELPLARALRGEVTVDRELSVVRNDGTVRHELASAGPVYDQDGNLIAAIVVFPDITERKLAEAELERTRALLEAVLQQSPAPTVVVTAEDMVVKYANRQAARVLGVEDEPTRLGKRLRDVDAERAWEELDARGNPIPPQDSMMARALRGETTTVAEHAVRRKDGSVRHVLASGAPVYDRDGALVAGLVLFPDVTELRETERALREGERRLRLALDVVGGGTFEYRPDEDVTRYDANTLAMFGLEPDEYDGGYETWKALLHPGDRDATVGILARAIEEAESFDATYRVVRPDGETRHIRAIGEVETDAGGRVVSVFGLHFDVTSERRRQDERIQMERRVQQAQRLESLGVLAGGIAHDFNNILAAVMGYLELSVEGLPPGHPVAPRLMEAQKAAGRAATLTRQLLAYSGRGRFVVQPISLNDLAESMLSLLTAALHRGVALRAHLAPDLPLVEGDASQLQQVILNLVTNAGEAYEGDGVVELSTSARRLDRAALTHAPAGQPTAREAELPEGLYVILQVRDEGCGMETDTLERVFEPFYTTKFVGRGLGMAAVAGIVRAHKGLVRIESTPGEGTTCTVLLPVVGSETPRETGAAKPAESLPEDGRRVVLVVDDEDMIRTMTQRMVELLGYDAVGARDGREAVAIVESRSQEIACVLLDVNMPGMAGDEVLQRIRTLAPGSKVVMASGGGPDEIEGFAPDGFVQKPYRLQALEAEVRRVLGG